MKFATRVRISNLDMYLKYYLLKVSALVLMRTKQANLSGSLPLRRPRRRAFPTFICEPAEGEHPRRVLTGFQLGKVARKAR